MLVEPAASGDGDAVRALDRALVGIRDRAEALREWIARGECLVARDDGKVVGFAVANTRAPTRKLFTEIISFERLR